MPKEKKNVKKEKSPEILENNNLKEQSRKRRSQVYKQARIRPDNLLPPEKIKGYMNKPKDAFRNLKQALIYKLKIKILHNSSD